MAQELRVAVMCPGAHHVNRGYERSLCDLHEVLTHLAGVDSTLVAGSPPRGPSVRVAPVLRRDRPTAKLISRFGSIVSRTSTGARLAAPIRDAYRVEQAVFAVSSVPILLRLRPHVLIVSDVPAARALSRLLAHRSWSPKIVFRNGAPLPPPYPFADLVQHLTPMSRRLALEAGEPAERHVLLTTGFHLDAFSGPVSTVERTRLRRELDLPQDRAIVLSVGALNTSHKRHDHLIEEFRTLLTGTRPSKRPYLVILGEEHPEGPAVRALARKLDTDDHIITNAAPDRIARWYRAADVFALASIIEALPRALVEAAAAGLPPVVHDCERTRWVLDDDGYFVDMEAPGALARQLGALLHEPEDSQRADRRRAAIASRFSWNHLGQQYRRLLERALEV